VSREFTAGSAHHQAFFERVNQAGYSGGLRLRGQIDLANIFVPAVQPGSTLDWDLGADPFAKRQMSVRQDLASAVSRDVTLIPASDQTVAPLQLALTGKMNLTGSGLTFGLDDKVRPIPLSRFTVPWARPSGARIEPTSLVRTDVKGNWMRGRRVFFGDGGCVTCHTLRGEGTAIGSPCCRTSPARQPRSIPT